MLTSPRTWTNNTQKNRAQRRGIRDILLSCRSSGVESSFRIETQILLVIVWRFNGSNFLFNLQTQRDDIIFLIEILASDYYSLVVNRGGGRAKGGWKALIFI